MREIKFKAKSEKSDKWVFGTYYRTPCISQVGKSGHNRFFHYIVDGIRTRYEINPLTLCQFIGMKDNYMGSGHDLYENDMVIIRHGGEWSVHRITYQSGNDYPAFDLMPQIPAEMNGISHALCELGYVVKRIGNYYDGPTRWDRLMGKKS